MDELMQKMQGILSDPESMKQISELAQMLKKETGADTPAPDTAPPGTGFPFDPSMLIQVGELLNGAKQQDDNTAFLLALRPHLREERREKVDRAVKLLQMLTLWNLLKENGFLQNLL